MNQITEIPSASTAALSAMDSAAAAVATLAQIAGEPLPSTPDALFASDTVQAILARDNINSPEDASLLRKLLVEHAQALLMLRQTQQALRACESLEHDRRLVLELVAQDRPLADILKQVTKLIERQTAGAVAAIIPVVSGELLLYGPSLASEFSRTLRGQLLPLAAALVAGALETPGGVGVTDIENEPAWEFARAEARRANLTTCWTVQVRCNDGTPLGLIAVFSRASHAPSDAELSLLSMVNRLVTVSIEHYQTTRQLAHLVRHDTLTGLPNRILFEDRLQQALAGARRNDKLLAMFALDLDHFKDVNDTLGHQAGDELLQQFASRLCDQLRKTDTLARVGGDEFLLLLPEVAMPGDVEVVAGKLLAALEKPLEIAGKTLKISLSIGIAVYPADGEDGVSLLRQADAAMYRAKQAGRGGFSR